MALGLGKLTVLIGAGFVGSVLAKEGRLPSMSDFFSGIFKVAGAVKQLTKDDSVQPSRKPLNDSLLAQVNSLREELQMMAINRPITIVTVGRTGARRYGTILIVVAVGFGFIWWKGYKLPDMMFATRRSLSDACTSVAQQLENVYTSIRGTRRHLSAKIDTVNCNLDEVAELTASTRENVVELREGSETLNVDVRSVSEAVKTLGKRIYQIEGRQDTTLRGVKYLCDYAQDLENNLLQENVSSSPQLLQSPKVAALPQPSEISISTQASSQVSGLTEAVGISSSPRIESNDRSPKEAQDNSSSTSWWRPPFLSRTRSATNAVVRQVGYTREQS